MLNRYEDFKQEARAKREKLEDSRRFQYFKRDADELESWIQEKLQAASDESYKDPTNLQVWLLHYKFIYCIVFILIIGWSVTLVLHLTAKHHIRVVRTIFLVR